MCKGGGKIDMSHEYENVLFRDDFFALPSQGSRSLHVFGKQIELLLTGNSRLEILKVTVSSILVLACQVGKNMRLEFLRIFLELS